MTEPVPDAPELWDTDRVATLLHVSARTVQRMRTTAEGPPYVNVGRAIVYIPGSVLRWIKEQERQTRGGA